MKLIRFIDDYGFLIISFLFMIDFSITSSMWISSSPLLNLWDKFFNIFCMILFPLFPLSVEVIVLYRTNGRGGAGNYLKKFNFFVYFPIFVMSRIIEFIDFNFVSYSLIVLLILPIVGCYFVANFKFWREPLIYIHNITFVILYILSAIRILYDLGFLITIVLITTSITGAIAITVFPLKFYIRRKKRSYAAAWYNKACIESLQNNRHKAIEYLRKAINLENKHKETAKADNDFDNIRDSQEFKELTEG